MWYLGKVRGLGLVYGELSDERRGEVAVFVPGQLAAPFAKRAFSFQDV